MPYMTIAGERLFYTVHDQDAPLSLVCIHGAGGDHTIWPLALSELGACNTYTLDLPGHGRSHGAPRETVEAYAVVVEAFIAELGLQRVVLLGHSMGGAIAMTLALARPAWLDALILACTGCRLRVPDEISRLLRTDLGTAIEQLCHNSFSPTAPRSLVQQEDERRRRIPAEVFLADYDACDGFDVTERLGEIREPTLVLSGDIDHLTPVKYAQFLEDRIPNARLAVVAPAGHMLPVEQPAEMTRLVSEFVDRRVSR
ncbi:alpha/beta hydrolase [Aquisalimonas sp.]|uniref:alpha/beta fold hydrolase n=1 Tax=Aquisalimonas sp. TaxID=1872621 RepID=UPI0025C57C5D|nr:alpha/beta hydrolase [Aquisalimonas sp.]